MTGQRVETNGIELHCVDHPGGDPVLLYLPGLSATSSIFADLVDELSPQFRAVALDLRGRGWATIHRPAMIRLFQRELYHGGPRPGCPGCAEVRQIAGRCWSTFLRGMLSCTWPHGSQAFPIVISMRQSPWRIPGQGTA
jgi:pimeloyl-ACP methyl ester carboxylesterase